MTGDRFVCPACGFAELEEPPRSLSGGGSYEICPSCGFEYGVTDDDRGFTYGLWRSQWIADGMPWRDFTEPPPDWDPRRQLAALEDGS